MSSPEQNRTPTGVTDLPGGHGADDAARTESKRAWTAPTVTTFKVTDTRGAASPPGDGLNNGSNFPV